MEPTLPTIRYCKGIRTSARKNGMKVSPSVCPPTATQHPTQRTIAPRPKMELCKNHRQGYIVVQIVLAWAVSTRGKLRKTHGRPAAQALETLGMPTIQVHICYMFCAQCKWEANSCLTRGPPTVQNWHVMQPYKRRLRTVQASGAFLFIYMSGRSYKRRWLCHCATHTILCTAPRSTKMEKCSSHSVHAVGELM